jgi:hypothetical protein
MNNTLASWIGTPTPSVGLSVNIGLADVSRKEVDKSQGQKRHHRDTVNNS